MILAQSETIPNGLISNDKAKLAGTMVNSFTASWVIGPLKSLAATAIDVC